MRDLNTIVAMTTYSKMIARLKPPQSATLDTFTVSLLSCPSSMVSLVVFYAKTSCSYPFGNRFLKTPTWPSDYNVYCCAPSMAWNFRRKYQHSKFGKVAHAHLYHWATKGIMLLKCVCKCSILTLRTCTLHGKTQELGRSSRNSVPN